MQERNMPPFAPVLMQSTRAIGYSLEAAIADIIDNSIAAKAGKVQLSFFPVGDAYVSILDNGTGMDDAQMNIAMQYGSKSPTETRDSSDLGRYGLGLKTASLSQCRVLTVISKQGDQVIGRRWDLDYVIKTGAWSLLILDKEDFASVPHISDLYEQDSGTLVVWQNLDRLLMGEVDYEKSLGRKMDEVRQHLELVFHRYLSGESGIKKLAPSISDEALRFELNTYFTDTLSKKKKELSQTEKNHKAEELVRLHPELIDYYIRFKEENESQATSVSKEKVREVEILFNEQVAQLISLLNKSTDFYNTIPDAHDEAKKRVHFLKHVIEDQDGYRLFYSDGKPIKREADLQVIYRLVWFGTPLDVNREVNNGRGPVDYKVSYGANNSTLVEFKLASNSKLKNNLAKQVEIYKAASDSRRAIKVIMYFSAEEELKVISILNDLGLSENDDIILIDARNDNKSSASNVKLEKASE